MHSISHFVGGIFQPIFHLIGWMLAFIYDHIVPNYAISIALLTVVIMGVLTPFTVKSTRSMMAMQRLQPEIKKLQLKYKGPENRQQLNEEMMKLYKEEGVNPIGGCLPMLIQMPFLFILYSTIKGLAYTTTSKAGVITSHPRYIPQSSKMYDNLVASGGHINVWGMDLSLRPFPISVHGGWVGSLPFFAFAAVAVGLQYLQMAQMNNLTRKRGQPLQSQQLMMQRVLPVIFAYFYMVIPAAVVLYMIISTGIRIITQDIMFRTGVSNPNKGAAAVAGAAAIDADSEVIERPAIKAPPPKPTQKPNANNSNNNNRSKNQSKPVPKPQQPRSKAKRKRKAR
jgi:YidC/Oxa1 family membrane protein insertase